MAQPQHGPQAWREAQGPAEGSPQRPRLYALALLAPALLWALAAIVLVAWLAPSGAWWIAGLMGLAALAAFAPALLARPRGVEEPAEGDRDEPDVASLGRLVMPAWEAQLTAARDEGNAAVEDLVKAFGDLALKTAAQLDAAKGAVADLTAADGAVPALRGTRHDLEAVVETLRHSEQTKEAILAEAVRAGDLSGLAAEVNALALQSRLLAMNAAIEASRAGDEGRAFGVVVTEMRALSERSSRAADAISRQAKVLAEAVSAIRAQERAVAGSSREDRIEAAERAVAGVGARVDAVASHLVESARSMERLAGEIKAGVSDSLVALQFQDRVSQVLHHTARCVAALRTDLAEPDGRWMGRLREYATPPEGVARMRSDHRTAPRREITFF